MKSNRSSAYKVILCSTSPRIIPIICCLSRRAIAKGSMAKVNKIGLKGQPCRVPQYKLNCLEYKLLVRTTAKGELNLIQEKKDGTKSKFFQK